MRRERFDIHQVTITILLAGFLFLNGQLTTPVEAQTRNDNSADSVQLYYFTSDSCPPCRQVEPEIIRLYEAGYPVFKVNAHRKPEWSENFGVTRTPTTILVKGREIVARHSGLIDARTVKGWFDSVGFAPSLAAAPDTTNHPVAPQTEIGVATEFPVSTAGLPDTLHRGTNRPSNDFERLALEATVRLKVEDPEGTSFATGTVIHAYDGEALVLTCGHVFRESNGDGKIICEYGFANDEMRISYGQLIYYDSEKRDIGLVAIGPNVDIEPVPIAAKNFDVKAGRDIFSIGCDHGETPTIRHSRIKSLASYSGVQKYDIFGRPVVGRSGGGLFTENGELIGICNAAVVDFDEGVYVGLESVHWQITKVNLNHLFDGSRGKINSPSIQGSPRRLAQNNESLNPTFPETRTRTAPAKSVIEQFPDDSIVRVDAMPSAAQVRQIADSSQSLNANSTLVSSSEAQQHPLARSSSILQSENDTQGNVSGELIVIYRENESAPMTTWHIQNPKTELLRELKTHPGDTGDSFKTMSPVDQQPKATDRMASLRQQMPVMRPEQDRPTYRTQSPR